MINENLTEICNMNEIIQSHVIPFTTYKETTKFSFPAAGCSCNKSLFSRMTMSCPGLLITVEQMQDEMKDGYNVCQTSHWHRLGTDRRVHKNIAPAFLNNLVFSMRSICKLPFKYQCLSNVLQVTFYDVNTNEFHNLKKKCIHKSSYWTNLSSLILYYYP
jgi:hypothetical protein